VIQIILVNEILKLTVHLSEAASVFCSTLHRA